MPRIDAATVAEHRARQRAALLRAAEEILITDGYESLNFATVAKAAGLARSSVYEYFTSVDDLVASLVEYVLPRWLTQLADRMNRARTPRGRLIAYIRTQLEMVVDGSHRLAPVLARAPLTPEVRSRIGAVHAQFAPNLNDVLAEVGHRDPKAGAAYVQAVVTEATRQLHAGAKSAPTIRAAVTFALGGVTAEPWPGNGGSAAKSGHS